MSLKSNLQQIIKDRNGGIFTLNELEVYCHNARYKLSNAERRLRSSESPEIERVFKDNAIVGYRWKQGLTITSENLPGIVNKVVKSMSQLTEPREGISIKDWCVKCGYFMSHSSSCQSTREKVNQLKF